MKFSPAILFIVGPLSMVIQAVPMMAMANAAADNLMRMDRVLREIAPLVDADVAAWLRRHGVVAESEARVRDERPAGDRILALVEQTGANLIVAGAWGHSRMREWVLGGVTQALLNRSQSWLLFSH